MKKFIYLFTVLFALFSFSGCEYNYRRDGLTTLFLVDERGFSYADIPYKCDSMRSWERTLPNGEFSFFPQESCTFDFGRLDGMYGDMYDDVVRITDDLNRGKGGIPYDCTRFKGVYTYDDGSFQYDQYDTCVFHL